jgi:hypothetical protein
MDMVVTAEGAYFQKILGHIIFLFLHQTACAIVYNTTHQDIVDWGELAPPISV